MRVMTKILAAMAGAVAGPALATTPPVGTIPESSILGLLVAGGIVAAIITIRKRRK